MKHSTLISNVVAVRFNVDDRIVVADPCYIDEDDCGGDAASIVDDVVNGWDERGKIFDGCAGDWIGEVEIETDTHGWGDRVSVLRARRADVSRHRRLSFDYVGRNGVDSGQMYIGGVENLPLNYERVLACYRADPTQPSTHENWVNRDLIAPEGGAVSSTGFGDGVYPVYVARDGLDGKVMAIEVHFLEDNEEEDSDE